MTIANYFEYVIKSEEQSAVTIRLTAAPYSGVVVTLGTRFAIINADTPEEGIMFDFKEEEIPEEIDKSLLMQKEYVDLLGEILIHMVVTMAEQQERQSNEELEPVRIEYDDLTKETTIHYSTGTIQ